MQSIFRISEAATAYAALRFSAPAWATGSINRDDAAFLCDMILRERPSNLAEIGVCSGVSTTFLSTLLADRLPGSRLHAFDIAEMLPGEPKRRIGQNILDVFGNLPANLTLSAGIGSTAIRSSRRRSEPFDFAFVDGNHQHPWPVLDLLSILDVVRPGAWIVLHDTCLPLLNRDYPIFGPLYLHQLWPGEVRTPEGDRANIAAIRLFDDPRDSAAALIEVLKVPWQGPIPDEEWDSAREAFLAADADTDGLAEILHSPPMARRPLMRNCEVVVRGANPMSQFPADPTADRLLLHANASGEPAMSLSIRNIPRSSCNGVIFPKIARAPEPAPPLKAVLSLRSSDGQGLVRRSLLLDDATPRSAYLLADHSFGEMMEVEISLALAVESRSIKGAWARFEGLHFV